MVLHRATSDLKRFASARLNPRRSLTRTDALVAFGSPAARLPGFAVFVLLVAASQEVVQDEIRDVAAEPLTAGQVVADMHARENAALRGFLGSRREARERSLDPREHFRRHVE